MVRAGGGVNGSSVASGVNAAAAAAGSGLMMLNGGVAMNPAASNLLMPNAAAAANAGLMMQRPVMLPSVGSPTAAAAGYLLAGGTGASAPTLLPQYIVGHPSQGSTSPDLAAANPYGLTVPQAAVYGTLLYCLLLIFMYNVS